MVQVLKGIAIDKYLKYQLIEILMAKNIGADILITSRNFDRNVSGTINMELPDTQTSYHSGNYYGNSGFGSYSGTSTTYGTKSHSIPYSVDRYDQDALFLKNVNNIKPVFNKVEDDYKKNGTSKFDGISVQI